MRADAIGIDVMRVQWAAFVVAGTFAGLAGALFAFSKGSISPESLHVARSIDGLVMVLLGGYTRLTHSGLSMVRWHPQTLLPPTSESAWQAAFDDYRRYPEYAKINSGMDLAGFKEIYWPEYIHRVWGRLIAFVLVVPFLWFLVRGAIARPMRWRISKRSRPIYWSFR